MFDACAHPTLVQLLQARAALHPERVALRFLLDGSSEHTVLSYAQLHERSCALAAALAERARPGERALLLYPSGPDYVIALLACFYAGVIAVPAYPPQSAQPQHVARVLSIARDAGPALLLTERAWVPVLSQLKDKLAELSATQVVATDERGPASADFDPRAITPDAVALLQYTSGSTAAPKGVMVSHGNLMANERAIQNAFSIRPDDVVVSWLPLFHDMGLIGTLLQPLYSGISGVLMPPQRFMERPRRWLEAISRFGGTVSGGPDFAYRLCAQRAAQADVSDLNLESWRLAFCGAEPVRARTLSAFADRFAAARFAPGALYPCYGLAEATLIVSGAERGEGVHTRTFDARELAQGCAARGDGGQPLVGCGRARPGHEIAIADLQSGALLPADTVGEILVSGPSVTLGYWQNSEATQRSFVRHGGRTFLRTGDLGFQHEGVLFVAGRQKDMIIVRGQNLYPQDIERIIEEQSEIVRQGRVVAFGLEAQDSEGIVIAAEVNPRMRKLIDAQAVCRSLAELVTQTFGEAPAHVLLVEPGAVPITSSGKLQRSACKRAWLDGELAVFAASQAGADDGYSRTSLDAKPGIVSAGFGPSSAVSSSRTVSE